MHITIKTYTDTRNMEVPQTESALYKAIGEQLLNLSVPNRLLVSTPVGEAELTLNSVAHSQRTGPSIRVCM